MQICHGAWRHWFPWCKADLHQTGVWLLGRTSIRLVWKSFVGTSTSLGPLPTISSYVQACTADAHNSMPSGEKNWSLNSALVPSPCLGFDGVFPHKCQDVATIHSLGNTADGLLECPCRLYTRVIQWPEACEQLHDLSTVTHCLFQPPHYNSCSHYHIWQRATRDIASQCHLVVEMILSIYSDQTENQGSDTLFIF